MCSPGDLRPPGPPGLDSKHGWPGPTEEVAIWGWKKGIVTWSDHWWMVRQTPQLHPALLWPMKPGMQFMGIQFSMEKLVSSDWIFLNHPTGFFMKGKKTKRALLSYFFGLAGLLAEIGICFFWRFLCRMLETYEIPCCSLFRVFFFGHMNGSVNGDSRLPAFGKRGRMQARGHTGRVPNSELNSRYAGFHTSQQAWTKLSLEV